ncbi:hypothetical protein Bealeia1_00855 [Candidatus Bealeia paramacronuclearis]|uniref:Ig-like domain-containing protein n=1 Tax=Candidatus Bealeia paramacronuclearis TaxID=1921001 RepID=A0ABZ2C4T0_9PROT|nr:hypothetical protein [Candidatus Bealeia paramacronuclearis]
MKIIQSAIVLLSFSNFTLNAEDRFLVECPNSKVNPIACNDTECTAKIHIELPNQKETFVVAHKTIEVPPSKDKSVTFTQPSASLNEGNLRCTVTRNDKIPLEFDWTWSEIHAEVTKIDPSSRPIPKCGATANGMSCLLN